MPGMSTENRPDCTCHIVAESADKGLRPSGQGERGIKHRRDLPGIGSRCQDSRSQDPWHTSRKRLLAAAIVKERLREYVGRQCHLGESITRNEKHCGIVQMAWYGDCRVRLQEFAAFRMPSIDYLSVLPCHGAGNYRLMAQEAGIQHQGTQSIILQDDRPSEP